MILHYLGKSGLREGEEYIVQQSMEATTAEGCGRTCS